MTLLCDGVQRITYKAASQREFAVGAELAGGGGEVLFSVGDCFI